MKLTYKIAQITMVSLATFLPAQQVVADDLDIFIAKKAAASVQPNILFITDTSGSMATKDVETLSSEYDPDTTYTGSYSNDKWYYAQSADTSKLDSRYPLDPNINACKELVDAMSFQGKFEGNLAGLADFSKYGYSNYNGWWPLNDSYVRGGYGFYTTIECQADNGKHGLNDSSDKVYVHNPYGVSKSGMPANGWTSDESKGYTWTGGDYFGGLYSGNYANYLSTVTVTVDTRINAVKSVLDSVLSSMSGVNFGLMSFQETKYNINMGTPPTRSSDSNGPREGGKIDEPIGDISTNRDKLRGIAGGYKPVSWTPLAETMHEAARYFKGDAPQFGYWESADSSAITQDVTVVDTSSSPVRVTRYTRYRCRRRGCYFQTNYWINEDEYNALSSSDQLKFRVNPRNPTVVVYKEISTPRVEKRKVKYKSPIVDSCQANAIIYLTDGEPTYDTNHSSELGSYISSASCSDDGKVDGNCLDDYAGWLADTDLSPLDGKQTVSTYTVGFKADFDLLKRTALNGKGQYFTVDSGPALSDAIRKIIRDINIRGNSFTAPGVSVNNFGRLVNSKNVYYSMFRPDEREQWEGNMKHYQVDPDNLQLIGQDGVQADDPTTGFIKGTAFSFWSDSADGAQVARGGAAGEQTLPRKIYTYVGATAPNNESLTDTANSVSVSNTAITSAMLGAATATEREQLLKWAVGYDVDDIDNDSDRNDLFTYIGDPVHSRPLLLTYNFDENAADAAALAASEESVLFFGTNQGYIHAISAQTGEELFAFMPKELLKNLKPYRKNNSFTNKTYGMDLSLSILRKDLNKNGKIYDKDGNLEVVDSDKEGAYIYAGMRRGGNSYYAFDVSIKDEPKLMWQIKGGEGDFKQLAQTWSQPRPAKVKFKGVVKDVLFFAGGYDERQDNLSLKSDDDTGRALFMVDAMTGKLLWKAGAGEQSTTGNNLRVDTMKNSIVAAPYLIDVNSDKLIDIVFLVDTGGRVFRFDVDTKSTRANDFATGGVVAEISGANADSDRKFFADIRGTLIRNVGEASYVMLGIGTGKRPNPLEEVTDNRFYLIKQGNLNGAPKDADGKVKYTKMVENDLVDMTNSPTLDASAKLKFQKNGYFIRLEKDGEKVLVPATFAVSAGDPQVRFISFKPKGTAASCSGDTGENTLYKVNILSGKVTSKQTLKQGGIAPEVTILKVVDANGDVIEVELSGTEVITKPGDSKPNPLTNRNQLIKFWTEKNDI